MIKDIKPAMQKGASKHNKSDRDSRVQGQSEVSQGHHWGSLHERQRALF